MYTLYFSMILYFGKPWEIGYTLFLFNKLFNIDIYRVCLKLLLLLLLLNVIALAIS